MNDIIKSLKLDIFFTDDSLNDPTASDFVIIALYNSEKIAHASFYHESGFLYSFEVFVKEDYRRKGVATQIYNYAEELSQKRLFPHHENPYNYQPSDVSDDALNFWNNRKR